ncbi:RNA 2',3'-cyclic phosphodiesterase [candidate division KSB1 bacterium]
MIRTFIAVKIPSVIQQVISDFQKSVSEEIPGIRWIKPENIHITLKFIGEIKEELVDRIIRDVMNVPQGEKKFDLSISGTGVFPNLKRPRIFWIGINRGSKKLSKLASCIEDRLIPMGIQKEKRSFKPHITIGRFKNIPHISGLSEFVSPEVFGECEFPVSEFHLMKSTLMPTGAEYESLAGCALQ